MVWQLRILMKNYCFLWLGSGANGCVCEVVVGELVAVVLVIMNGGETGVSLKLS